MQLISLATWERSYHVQTPSFIQRWWIQRWLELTDVETDDLRGLPVTNSKLIMAELISWKEREKNTPQGRTLFFLLAELQKELHHDLPLYQAIDIVDAQLLKELNNKIHCLVKELGDCYNSVGVLKTDYKKVDKITEAFRDICDTPDSYPQPPTRLLNRIYALLNTGGSYVANACSILERLLSNDVNSIEDTDASASSIKNIEHVTCILLTELVTSHNYTISFLNKYCSDFFLQPRPEAFFVERLQQFFLAITTGPRSFDVFMRVQVKREILQIERIGRALFCDRIPDIGNLISESYYNGLIEPEEENNIREFFYDGDKKPTLLFAIFTDIEAEDYSKAASIAIQYLDQAIQRAKFEYALDGFSVDNKLYVYSKQDSRFTFYTRRQIMRVQFQTHKQLLQLERLLFVLNEIEVNRNLGPEVIEKISNYNMRWFRLGRDAITPDIKLLHHWFALEQLFKLIPERIEGKASSGDKCVLAIATTLSYRHQRRVLGNLWRDIVRLGLLGPDPVFALRESEVTYNDTLRHIIYRQPQNQRLPIAITDDNYYYVTSRTANLPQLILRSHTDGNQTTTILPGSVLYVSENAKVLEGQVITSAFLRAGEESVLVDILGNVQLKVSSFWFFLVSVLFQGHNIEQYISQDNIRRCHQMLSDHVSKYKNQFAYSHGNNLTNEGASVLVTITAVLKLLLERVEAIYHGREIKFLTSIDGRLSAGCGKATQIFILIEELEVLCQEIKSSFASTGLQTKDVTTAWLLENLPETQEIFFKSRQQSIINKLERFAKKRDLLLNILPVYVYLQELSQSIGAEKWRYMALERFRGAKLDPRGDVKRFVVFAPLASDQPLLFSRIKNPSGPDLSSDSLDYYIWQLDRMRRIRNSLVHNAISGSNIEILAIRLQQYTQIYLRLVIGRLATLNEPWVDKKYWTLGFEH